jgi:hypothetical protein
MQPYGLFFRCSAEQRMKIYKLIAILAPFAACSSSAQAISLAEMKERTAVIASRYLEIWSANNASPISGVPYMYGPTVIFYGKRYTQANLVDEKRRAIRQWPVRQYVHRPGTLKIDCNASTLKCAARSTIDFDVSNPSKGTSKSGSAKFDLGVSFADRHPVILYEGGSLNSQRAGR